ncbi:hypothetical protein JessAGP_030 [Caulobacter phage Jess A]|nr:hypothetical protein JessAGP_030 [Caulobacter phage Jess A]QNH91682.1 hypothetical protein SR18_gp031 [Caulobacter phage SR18]WCA46439.1 hypothetical protein [Caulobacter phage RapA]WCD56215.1 hypothetical protein [Caulobacter phage BL94]
MRDPWKERFLDWGLLACLALAGLLFVLMLRLSDSKERVRLIDAHAHCTAVGGEMLDTSNGYRCVRKGAVL